MNYEEKYKEALERAKVYHTGGSISDAHITEVIFPELKENKSERMRKGLIKTISSLFDNTILYNTDITKEEALAWLEKQGENKKLDADKVIEWLKNTIKERAENYGVYKATRLILPYDSIEDLINDFKEDFRL